MNISKYAKMTIIALMTLLSLVNSHAIAQSGCSNAFVKLLNGDLPAMAHKNPALSMWDDRFDAEILVDQFKNFSTKADKIKNLKEMQKFVGNDQTYVDNLTKTVNRLTQEGHFQYSDLKAIFLGREIDGVTFYWSHKFRRLTGKVKVDQSKLAGIKSVIGKHKLTASSKKEYQAILMRSNLTAKEVDIAVKAGMKLQKGKKFIEQFEDYIEYISFLKEGSRAKALKKINEIYDFGYKHSAFQVETFLPQNKKFLIQQSRLKQFEDKRYQEILKGFKMQESDTIIKRMDDMAVREKSGIKISKAERADINRHIDDVELPKSLKERARAQAKGERHIFKKLKNGCRSGDGKRMASAAKKFKRFKFALALVGTPTFYYMKNKDKLGKDNEWFEKLGYEMGIGLVFTFVGNKIMTNTSTGFWGKYVQGYTRFGALDSVTAFGYDSLFGKNSYIRYIQQIYSGKDLAPSEVEEQFEKLKKSPTFDQDVKKLFAYLEEQSKKNNTKNFLNKYINLHEYSSGMDDKITQEDLETEEGREMMMELLSERMYLSSMGNWPIFQTGNRGADRFAFYRARNLVWDMKGIALNLAIFQIMCREPLGKVGSWGLILGMVLGEQYLSGDLTYGARRDAINQ